MKVLDLFYKRGKESKTEYVGSCWEGRYADEQKAKGNEPWLDVNLSRVINGKREYATSIIYGGKHELKLGKDAGVFIKAGFVEGIGARPTGTREDVAEALENIDEEPAAPVDGALDLSELE